jgi:hypothetical protein
MWSYNFKISSFRNLLSVFLYLNHGDISFPGWDLGLRLWTPSWKIWRRTRLIQRCRARKEPEESGWHLIHRCVLCYYLNAGRTCKVHFFTLQKCCRPDSKLTGISRTTSICYSASHIFRDSMGYQNIGLTFNSIQFNPLVFMCRVNSHKANYRHSTVQIYITT